MTLSGKRLHRCTLPLRRGDMDARGQVNNVLYIRHLEEARLQNPGEQHARSSR